MKYTFGFICMLFFAGCSVADFEYMMGVDKSAEFRRDAIANAEAMVDSCLANKFCKDDTAKLQYYYAYGIVEVGGERYPYASRSDFGRGALRYACESGYIPNEKWRRGCAEFYLMNDLYNDPNVIEQENLIKQQALKYIISEKKRADENYRNNESIMFENYRNNESIMFKGQQ